MKYIDRIGNVYGKLKVISRLDNDRYGFAVFLCLCDCGNYKSVRGCNLDKTHSCGCIREARYNIARERKSRYRNNPGKEIIISKTFPADMKVRLTKLAESRGTSIQNTINFVLMEWIENTERRERFNNLTEPVYEEEGQ
jgi:hypothetical protein